MVRACMARVIAVLLVAVGLAAAPLGLTPASANNYTCGFTTSASVGQPIPDMGKVVHSIAGPGDIGTMVDVDVFLNLTHTFDGDLSITLTHGGREVELSSHNGGSGDNYTNTTFSDEATTAITAGVAPFTGTFQPEQPLNALDGTDGEGPWTLTVADEAPGDSGSLGSWGLRLRSEFCEDRDEDGFKNTFDLCPDTKGAAPSGCPARARSLSVRFAEGAFRGRLTCAAQEACHQQKLVVVRRVASGPDPAVGSTFTNSTGTYVVPSTARRGQFYAVAPSALHEPLAFCKTATSSRITS